MMKRHHQDMPSYKLWDELSKFPRYKAQAERIMDKFCGDIDPSCLGFMDVYHHLAAIIPKGRTIYDLGCSYAFQAYYFRDHKAYVGVDLGKKKFRLFCPNTRHLEMSIRQFVETQRIEVPHFAICSYVPPWHNDNEDLVRRSFKHLFVYYPMNGDYPDFSASVVKYFSASVVK